MSSKVQLPNKIPGTSFSYLSPYINYIAQLERDEEEKVIEVVGH